MPKPNPAAFEFLQSRRSHPPKTLTLPVPERAEIGRILTAAARSPDHGKLEPWRFVVLEKSALIRIANLAEARATELGLDDERRVKGRSQYDQSHLAIVVVSSPKPSEKVPESEQILSSGAVCAALVNASLASGWGACWLTGWPAHDREFAGRAFGVLAHESVAGIVHIGSETHVPPERPRPDVPALTTWVSE